MTTETLEQRKDASTAIIGVPFKDVKNFLSDYPELTFRISRFNGVAQMGTCDMQGNRLNLVVEDGVVTECKIG